MNNIKVDTTIDGKVTFNVNPEIDTVGNTGITLRQAGTTRFFVSGTSTYTIVGRNSGSKLIFYDTYVASEVKINGPDATGANGYATLGQNDLKYLQLTGGTMSGDLTVGATITATDAGIGVMTDKLRAYSTSGIYTVSPLFYAASVITEFGTTNPMGTGTLVHKGYVDDNFVDLTTTQTVAGNKTLTGTTVLAGLTYCNTPTSTTQVANKSYVDDNIGVDLTSAQTITGQKTFTNTVNIVPTTGQATLALNTPDGISAILMKQNGVEKGAIYTTDGYFRIRRDVGASDNLIDLYDTYTAFSKNITVTGNITGSAAPTADGHVTRKDYVDDNFLENSGTQTFNGDLSITGGGGNSLLYLKAPTSSAPIMLFTINDVESARIVGATDRVQLKRTGGPTFTLFDTYAHVDSRLKVDTPTETADATTKGYVDDNTNVVQQTTGYQFVMPAATPTAGQSLEVGSVSGTTVTMVWV